MKILMDYKYEKPYKTMVLKIEIIVRLCIYKEIDEKRVLLKVVHCSKV